MFQPPKDQMYYTEGKDGKTEDVYMEKLKTLQTLNIDEQAKSFLRAFVQEFQGKFEAVLDVVEEFRAFVTRSDNQLDEQQAHLFLEKKGETHTALEFREKMRLIDIDFNKRISIIEWLLFKYKKTVKEMFDAKPNLHLIKMLEEAIAKFQAVFKAKKDRESKMAELEKTANGGGPGAAKARSELKSMQMEDPSKSGASEIDALAAKLKAKRALRNPDDEAKRQQEEAFKAEQARVAAEKQAKEDEERRKREESRQKLAARAKLFGAS